MKKLFVVVMVIVMMVSSVAFATGHKMTGLRPAEDFKYKDDPRITAVGWDYGDERFDVYIHVGDAFVINASTVEDPEVVHYTIKANREERDVVLLEDSYRFDTYEETISQDVMEDLYGVMLWMLDNGWA